MSNVTSRCFALAHRAVVVSIALSGAVVSAAAPADRPNPYLVQAKVFYQGLEYEKCTERLNQAVRFEQTPAEEVEIALYQGLCAFNLGNEASAKERFRAALEKDPRVQLPPFTSPKIVSLFETLRPRPADLPSQERGTVQGSSEPDTPPMATTRDRAGQGSSRVIPWVLGGVALAAVAVGGGFGLSARDNERRANFARFQSDAIAFGARARDAATVANASFGVAAVAAAGAMATYFLFSREQPKELARPVVVSLP